MGITNKDIANDVEFIIRELNQADVEIPSFWQCTKLGVLAFTCLMSLQAIVSFFTSGDTFIFIHSLFFAFVMGLLISSSIIDAKRKYLCLPLHVRKNSTIIDIIKKKAFYYSVAWCVLSILASIIIIYIQVWPHALFACELIFLVLIGFISNADLGRYELSVLIAAIAAWRSGGALTAGQLPAQPTVTPGGANHPEQ